MNQHYRRRADVITTGQKSFVPAVMKEEKKLKGDRYLPMRDVDVAHVDTFLGDGKENCSVEESYYANSVSRVLGLSSAAQRPPFRPPRQLPTQAERMLDIPGMTDNYYANVLDWGTKFLAIALQDSLYLYDWQRMADKRYLQLPAISFTAVKWARDGSRIALGTDQGDVGVYDVETRKRLLAWRAAYAGRIGCLAWNAHTFAAGSQSGCIDVHDMRCRAPVYRLTRRWQEVCGLAWNADQRRLAAGYNDNLAVAWEPQADTTKPRLLLQGHLGAVKALAWRGDILATGGGTADKTIKFWNDRGECTKSVETDSQVTGLIWSPDAYSEIVSAHGFSTLTADSFPVCMWNYPSMEKTFELRGHTERILTVAKDPENGVIATASCDETLRFWRMW